ncbi:MAG: hypothetical protein U5R46_13375 [Gammaproteobacteria bacterium]|nr:hypothetical protein [Gammaproteobacteria bacterium]
MVEASSVGCPCLRPFVEAPGNRRRSRPGHGKAKYSIIAVLGLFLAACGGPEESPEARIKDLISRAEQAAEDHDLSVFRDSVSDDYQDDHGYNRQTVLRLVQGMLLRNRSIHLLSLVREVRVGDGTAHARVLVAMASRPIESADALLNVRADLMRFDVQLVLEGDEWWVRAVDWERAEMADFL